PPISSWLLFGDGNRRIGAVRRHVDIVRLYDELSCRVRLLLGYDLAKLRVVVRCVEAFVPLRFRGIAPNVNECVLGADTQLRIALLRDPVAYIGDPVSRIDGSGAGCETCGERIPLSRLGCVYAQLVEPDSVALLGVAPADPGYAEHRA